MYAVKDNGAWMRTTLDQQRREQGASFPSARAEDFGIYEVTVEEKPEQDGKAAESSLIDRGGRPVQTWTLRNMTAEELAAEQERLANGVNRERERRIIAGTSFSLADGTEIHMQGRDEDMTNLLALYNAAQAQKAAGVTDPVMVFRDRENIVHNLTPEQTISVYQQGTSWVQSVYQASWALKDNPPIPRDYANDSYWPS